MPILPETRIAELLAPFFAAPNAPALPELPLQTVLPALSTYLDLLVRWNARTNLTAIRDPEEIVTRHFGESLFTGRLLAGHVRSGDTVLDFGSGAGFPGLPIKLLLPSLHVTLAESQNKKAAFLREAARTLGCDEIWAGRVEVMPPARLFSAVTLRAVDRMDTALAEAAKRRAANGLIVALTGEPTGLSTLIPGSLNRFVDIHPAG